jgi:hypothetical protein
LPDSSSRRGGHHRWTGPTNRIAAPVRLQPIGRAASRFATERRDGAERALPLGLDAVVFADAYETPARDDKQERRPDLPFTTRERP